MSPAVRRNVISRASNRCEYCRLNQEHESDRVFHVEHIVAISHGGSNDLSNLALACQSCNYLKGPNLSSIDPDSGNLKRLFHPRKDVWTKHSQMEGPLIIGMTPVGRTTAWLLDMNHKKGVELRAILLELGEWS